MNLRSLPLALMLLVSPVVMEAQQTASSPAGMEKFVDGLLAKMSVDEKVNQLEQAAGQNYTAAQADDLARQGKVGSFLFLTDPVRINELQKIAMTEAPHPIPLLFGYDVIHGFRTINPIPLALASSWNPSLVEHAQTMAAREARAAGITWAFSPMVDIARDARWGRIMEGAGEDPYLGEQMAAAQVHGLQGPVLGGDDHILACVKHFGGYGGAFGGRDYDSVDLSEDLLRNVYLRPYWAAVKAGAATVMAAYMDLDDVPATGNKWLLQDILRSEWGFKGFVVSDWESVKNLTTHGFAKDTSDAAYRGFTAGVNMEMTSDTYRQSLPKLVTDGKITKAQLDAMVRPILEMKYRLGLFTNPYVDMAKFKRETLSSEQRAAAKAAAEGSAVLMRNEGHLLPLAKGLKTIAVVGPLADSQVDTIGSWSLHATPADTVTIVQGLREKLPETKLLVAKGVEIKRTTWSIFDSQAPEPKPTLLTDEQKKQAFDEALADVKQADLTIMVLGEAQNMNGENASRATLTLPGRQEELLEAAVATGKPIVLVLMTGRPLDITWAAGHVPAILNVWYPGTEGGHAVADLLTGDAAPSGKLPLSWPRSVGQEPLFYNANLTQDPGARGNRYWDEPSTPLYPFGFGLSYTTFAMDELAVGATTLARDGSVDVRVRVKNTGAVAGEDVVQMYTHQRSGSASRPARELKGFTKIALKPGEERVVTLRLSADELHFWSPTLHKDVLEAGTFDVWVGDDSNASLHGTVDVQE